LIIIYLHVSKYLLTYGNTFQSQSLNGLILSNKICLRSGWIHRIFDPNNNYD